MNLKVFSVTELTGYIKRILESDIILRRISVEGEISNFKQHSSGHLYFTLKDAGSNIRCTMFRTEAQTLARLPKDGEKAVVEGKVSVYIQGGMYQMNVTGISLSEDTGDLYKKFRDIKEKLFKEGLFDESLKRKIPVTPHKIAVVTSPTGAAVRDIIRVMKHRNPGQYMVIHPVQVQGPTSEAEVIEALRVINLKKDADVIIIARGGGPIEDLWSFNSEKMAHAIRNSLIPVVTGIGHDIDYTIADFASDRRCATPSQAAEICIPDMNEKSVRLFELKRRMVSLLNERMKKERMNLSHVERFIRNKDPKVTLMNEIRYISDTEDRLKSIMSNSLDREKRRMKHFSDLMGAFNPYGILSRGYAIVKSEDGNILMHVDEIESQDSLKIRVSDGETKLSIRRGQEYGRHE